MAVQIGDSTAQLVYQGDMGIKQIYIGDELIFERSGGVFFLELNTTDEKE